ncbi:LOW QUALITY PROTEIN: mas-related G-protein coupled receptor member H-like [Melospiza georgiana]|uniref:LOW QUALITY PROTEIN: mas-related G-protein coupled receptor member H-like n=1 Tax=Melospiza georgiana TaxID=44398 RepID=UPI0025AD14FC|nr:LOW QUALITY PROTEIN: mas-related G-protein coupled receptor member H-like [Melospiza georgiana]
MEVSTESPTPASPSGGDDLCETDVTVATHSATLPICLCGLAGNRDVISLLSHNYGVFDLAVTDFLFLLFVVPSTLLILVEDVACSPIMTLLYLSFLFHMSVVSYYWGLFWLIAGSNVQYVYKLCWLCCRWKLPEHLRCVVASVQYWAFFALFAVIPAVTFLCPSHGQERCRAALISMYVIILPLFVAPMVISSTVDFNKAKWGSQQKQPKRRDIVTFLIVLFMFLLSIWNCLQYLGYTIVSSQAVFLLACIHSTIKPFIYFLVGRCWRPCSVGSLRLSLQRVFEETDTSHSHDPAMHIVL